MDDAVESYLTELARTEHDEPVLVEMETRAAEHGFPIVGRATGRFLELAAGSGARRVMSSHAAPPQAARAVNIPTSASLVADLIVSDTARPG
jgi:hypothetical protein